MWYIYSIKIYYIINIYTITIIKSYKTFKNIENLK